MSFVSCLGCWGQDLGNLANDTLNLMSDIDEITLGDGCVGVKDVVDTINNTLDLVGEVCDDATLGTRGQDLGNLTNNTLDLVSDVDEVTLGGGGKNIGDLANDTFDLVRNVDKVTLGMVGVKDMVDAINDTLDLVG